MPCPKTIQMAVFLMVVAAPVMAQQPMSTTSPMMPMASDTSGEASASSKAFKAADDKMMREMDHPMTGNTDQDFVAGMLPHHSGAVAMARAELEYGKDPEMRRLAKRIIAAQQKEITQMHAWWRKEHHPGVVSPHLSVRP